MEKRFTTGLLPAIREDRRVIEAYIGMRKEKRIRAEHT